MSIALCKEAMVFLVRKNRNSQLQKTSVRLHIEQYTCTYVEEEVVVIFWTAEEQGLHENQNKHVCPKLSCLSIVESMSLICVRLVGPLYLIVIEECTSADIP